MSQLGSEFSSNIQSGREYGQEKERTLQKIKEQQSGKQASSDTFVTRDSVPPSTCAKLISGDSFPATASAIRRLNSVFEIQVTVEINMREENEGLDS